MLKGKNILIGVSGSIAAYKIPYLVRLFIKEGASVKVVMTPVATDFVTPLTLSTLSNNPIGLAAYDPKDGSWNNHIEYGEWADVYLIAPASANTIAKVANGQSDNLLTCVYLAARCPVFIAPAMDLDMYKHSATQENIEKLRNRGHQIIEPTEGHLASGLCGAGRLEEPENIVERVRNFFFEKKPLKGKRFLVTAGPTYEPIDAVRFVGNFSSGKMGFAIAEEAAKRGAVVVLVAGPVSLSISDAISKRVDVTTAKQMLDVCQNYFSESDIVIGVAAVADFSPIEKKGVKLSKKGAVGSPAFSIDLLHTEDILFSLGKQKSEKQLMVGFALESENLLENAKRKLKYKNLDMIVANSANEQDSGFNSDTNRVKFVFPNEETKDSGLKSKKEIASIILDEIQLLETKNSN